MEKAQLLEGLERQFTTGELPARTPMSELLEAAAKKGEMPDWVDDAFKKKLRSAIDMTVNAVSADMPKGRMSFKDVADLFITDGTNYGRDKETHKRFNELKPDQAWKLTKELFPKGVMFYGAED